MKKITFLLTLLLLMIGGSKESAFAAADWGLSSSSLDAITANQTVVIKEAPSGLSGWSSNAYLNSGSSSVIYSVTESMTPAEQLASAKEAACAEVDALAQLTTLFSVDADALKANINDVTLTDNNADAAVATINNLVRTAFNVNDKSITFSNLRNDERSGFAHHGR